MQLPGKRIWSQSLGLDRQIQTPTAGSGESARIHRKTPGRTTWNGCRTDSKDIPNGLLPECPQECSQEPG